MKHRFWGWLALAGMTVFGAATLSAQDYRQNYRQDYRQNYQPEYRQDYQQDYQPDYQPEYRRDYQQNYQPAYRPEFRRIEFLRRQIARDRARLDEDLRRGNRAAAERDRFELMRDRRMLEASYGNAYYYHR